VILAAYCKATYPVIVIILDNLIGFALVAEIVLVEDDDLLLLVLLDDEVEFRIATAIRNACIPDLHKNIDLMRIFLDDSQGLLHMAWKPVDVVFQMLYYVHSIDPTII
jgi:hypothetical protein